MAQAHQAPAGNRLAWVRGEGFQELTLAVIVLNALLMGAEAVPSLAEALAQPLYWFFAISQVFFVVEIALRVASYWPQPRRFFDEGWNVFDLSIVALSLTPAVGGFALAARLLRVCRVLRLASASELLRDFFGLRLTRAETIVGLFLLYAIFIYVYALFAFHLFGAEQAHACWSDLGSALRNALALLVVQGVQACLGPSAGSSVTTWIFAGSFFAIHLALLGYGLKNLLGRRAPP